MPATWDLNIFENSSVIAEGRRRTLCSCLVAILIGSLLLALIAAIEPNSPGFYAIVVGGVIILFLGIGGIVVMCLYYPMDFCKRRPSRNVGHRQEIVNTSAPPTPQKSPSPPPDYNAPPSYEKAVIKQEMV